MCANHDSCPADAENDADSDRMCFDDDMCPSMECIALRADDAECPGHLADARTAKSFQQQAIEILQQAQAELGLTDSGSVRTPRVACRLGESTNVSMPWRRYIGGKLQISAVKPKTGHRDVIQTVLIQTAQAYNGTFSFVNTLHPMRRQLSIQNELLDVSVEFTMEYVDLVAAETGLALLVSPVFAQILVAELQLVETVWFADTFVKITKVAQILDSGSLFVDIPVNETRKASLMQYFRQHTITMNANGNMLLLGCDECGGMVLLH